MGPNKDGLPGINEATMIVNPLLTFGQIAVAGIVLAAITWSVGSHKRLVR